MNEWARRSDNGALQVCWAGAGVAVAIAMAWWAMAQDV